MCLCVRKSSKVFYESIFICDAGRETKSKFGDEKPALPSLVCYICLLFVFVKSSNKILRPRAFSLLLGNNKQQIPFKIHQWKMSMKANPTVVGMALENKHYYG